MKSPLPPILLIAVSLALLLSGCSIIPPEPGFVNRAELTRDNSWAIGDTFEKVVRCQGSATNYTYQGSVTLAWYGPLKSYQGGGTITFENGIAVGFENWGWLRVLLTPTGIAPNPNLEVRHNENAGISWIEAGTKNDLLLLYGTPSSIREFSGKCMWIFKNGEEKPTIKYYFLKNSQEILSVDFCDYFE